MENTAQTLEAQETHVVTSQAPESNQPTIPNEPEAELPSASQIDPLDELKEIDFLLEDIEDKIAPLALA